MVICQIDLYSIAWEPTAATLSVCEHYKLCDLGELASPLCSSVPSSVPQAPMSVRAELQGVAVQVKLSNGWGLSQGATLSCLAGVGG